MNTSGYLSKTVGCIKSSVRKFDLFSKNIMFTYKGESSFSTFFGGCVSIIILSLVTAYFLILMQVMITRGRTNNSKNSQVVYLTVYDEDYYPTNCGLV